MKISRVLLAITLTTVVATLAAQDGESPYFQVLSDNPQGSFPLLSTSADVQITGPIADVRIIQTYQNKSEAPIEALYVFPASTRAAVYQMEMHIGKRVITAEIMERKAATATYEKAKQEGKRASLLEEHRPNVFQMKVANLMPDETIEVYLYYTEFIIPESQEYTFVYPTVVGPRYNSGTGRSVTASFAAMPYLHSGTKPTYSFDIRTTLNMPVPITHISCASHHVDISRPAPQIATIALSEEETDGGNRDFILNYALSGNQIASGVLTYSRDGDQYFLCQIEPPKLKPTTVIVPREYIFIIDVSGSMHGFPLSVSKELMHDLLGALRPTDRFNILFFAGGSFMLSPTSLNTTKENISAADAQMTSMQGGGVTELLPALKRAMAAPKLDGYARSFVIITDGYVTIEEEAFRLVKENLDKASFFAFGIGSAVNRYLIEGLAHVGGGEPFIVTDQNKAKETARRFKSYIEHPMLTDIHVDAQGVQLDELIPEKIPDLMAARPIYFTGKYCNQEMASLTVTGKQGNIPFSTTVNLPAPRVENAALRYLWAREKIRYLSDFNSVNTTADRINEITVLGLQYNLLTRYTSFVAVDQEMVNEGGETKHVNQPLPLPQGMSDYAVGFEMELPEIVEGIQSHSTPSHSINVDIKCTDHNLKVFAESAIELAMQKMTPTERWRLIGTSVVLHMQADGSVQYVSGDQSLSKAIIKPLEDAIKRLNLRMTATQVIRISLEELQEK